MIAPTPPSTPDPAPPLGPKGPRWEVLLRLKRAGPSTARELAAAIGATVGAVRHHLKELAVEGLVAYERELHGVGAPIFRYRLTVAAEALFPRRYEQALTEVLDQVAEQGGRAAAVALLQGRFERLAARMQRETADLAPAERLAAVARALSDEGYMAEWEASPCCGSLTQHNCAIHALAVRYPEVCAAEERLLARVVGGSVERRAHILAGCGTCEYKIRFAPEWVDYVAPSTSEGSGETA